MRQQRRKGKNVESKEGLKAEYQKVIPVPGIMRKRARRMQKV